MAHDLQSVADELDTLPFRLALIDMQLAAANWRDPDALERDVRAFVEPHLPDPGEVDHRDFAWHYQWNLLENSAAKHPAALSPTRSIPGT